MSPCEFHSETREHPFTPDPASVYRALTDETEGDGVLLEFGRGSTAVRRRSLVFADPALRIVGRGRTVRLEPSSRCGSRALGALRGPLTDVGEVEDRAGAVRVRVPEASASAREAERLRRPSILDVLRAVAFGWKAGTSSGESPLKLPGIFSYDLVDAYEDLPDYGRDPLEFPDFVFWLPRTCVAIDHGSGTTRVHRFAYRANGLGDTSESREAFERTVRTVVALRGASASPESPPTTGANGPREVSADVSDESYAELVRELKAHIEAGDIFQAVPSRTFRMASPQPFDAYLRLREQNPSPYAFYVAFDGDRLFGASPETSVRVDPQDETLEIRPIAGTRGRGHRDDGSVDPFRDAGLENELRLDDKEVAEHSMLVDLARNDVGRVSRPGTVEVDRLMGVDRFSDVMHLVSHVRGRLEPELDALHGYAASMNMGTLVGAPKLRAASLLRKFEREARGPYGGAVGTLSADGGLETAIVIRSAYVPEETGEALVRAGAGVVADSDPEAEAEETRAKARAVLRAVGGSAARPTPDRDPAVRGARFNEDPEEVDILLVDNRDSFVFNLADVFGRLGATVEVWRNDADRDRLVDRIQSMSSPRLLLLSPGPGRPEEAGCSPTLVDRLVGDVPILGVCLGHQVLVRALGGSIERAARPVHGQRSKIRHCASGLFDGLETPLPVGRYHSLAASDLPDRLRPTAQLADAPNTIMAVRDERAPVAGFQFHPESILTASGSELVANALDWARAHDEPGTDRRDDVPEPRIDTSETRRMP